MVKKLPLLNDPMPVVGGYSVHIYCKWDNPDAHFLPMGRGEFDGETYGECIAAARRKGWVIHRDQTSTCPNCAKELGLTK